MKIIILSLVLSSIISSTVCSAGYAAEPLTDSNAVVPVGAILPYFGTNLPNQFNSENKMVYTWANKTLRKAAGETEALEVFPKGSKLEGQPLPDIQTGCYLTSAPQASPQIKPESSDMPPKIRTKEIDVRNTLSGPSSNPYYQDPSTRTVFPHYKDTFLVKFIPTPLEPTNPEPGLKRGPDFLTTNLGVTGTAIKTDGKKRSMKGTVGFMRYSNETFPTPNNEPKHMGVNWIVRIR